MRLKLQVEHVRRGCAIMQRLGQPGHADEQAVAAGEEGGEELLDDLVLADDDLADLLEEFGLTRRISRGIDFRGRGRWGSCLGHDNS